MYSVGELRKRTNISVRTLHYYDELGLLKPSRVTETGYRYYSKEDVLKLQQITALKKLGFPLSRIKDILNAEDALPAEIRWKKAIRGQIGTIREEMERLRRLERLLFHTLYSIEITGDFRTDDIFSFIQAMQPEKEPSNDESREQFFNEHFTPEEIEVIDGLPTFDTDDPKADEWVKLLRDIRDHMHEPPQSPVAQRLAKRVMDCAEAFFGANTEVMEKYWELIRPSPGDAPVVYGLDYKLMAYIDQIVEWYEKERGKERDEQDDRRRS